MDASEESNTDALPPSYDETVRNRKKSSVTGISQQKSSFIKDDPTKQENDIKNIINETKDRTVIIDDTNAPKDRLLFILVTVTLLGLVHQLPNSFYGMANEYWMYKFRNTTLNTTDANHRTYLQVNFSALTGVVTAALSVICNFLLTFVAHNIRAKTRVMVTLILHCIIFCAQIAFVNINTDSWQEQFFILTMGTMVVVICSISFGAAGQYGLIPKLPPTYMKSFLLGGGIAGLFNGVMRLLSVAITPSAIGSANIYFGTANFLLIATTIMTYIALNAPFFRHYTDQVAEVKEKKIRTFTEFREVLMYIWPMLILNIFLIGVPSGSVSNLVVSEYHEDKSNVWANQYFITVCSYLIPAITNPIGRAIYNKLDWNWSMPAMFLLVVFYQTVNTATIYLSNALPRHHLPVLFKHDWQYALVMGLHGFAIGFIWNMTTMKSIRMVPPEKTELTMLLLYLFNSIIQAVFSPLGVVTVNLI